MKTFSHLRHRLSEFFLKIVSNEICRENQNTNFMLRDLFPKIVSFMR